MAALQSTAPVSTLTSRSSFSARLQQIALSNDLDLLWLPQLISFLLAGETGRRLWLGTLEGWGEDKQEVASSLGAAEEIGFLCSNGGFIKTRGTLSFKGHQKCNQPTLVRLYFNSKVCEGINVQIISHQ